MAKKLISARETRERLGGFSAMSEHRHRKAGLLPPPVKICGRKFDPENDIDQIQAARVAGAADDDIKMLVARIVAERAATAADSTAAA